jgi:retron-type reverse transcriptase
VHYETTVPTVQDRLIQQALLQVLQPEFEPEFSEHSYGFRPGRNAWQAVQRAQKSSIGHYMAITPYTHLFLH